jgi:hypothetical protein
VYDRAYRQLHQAYASDLLLCARDTSRQPADAAR